MITLIVGASSGIGLECARFALRRSTDDEEARTVILGCRNAERASAAVRRLRQEFGESIDVRVELLDLASLNTVKLFAQRIAQQYTKIDVLILNAGVMLIPRETTVDGFDVTFQTNHLVSSIRESIRFLVFGKRMAIFFFSNRNRHTFI